MQIPQEWTFANQDVAEGFDHHVREQLPWYDLLTSAVAYIGRHYIPQGGLVYDIGASTGNIGRALQTTLDSRNAELIAIEESAEMAALYDGPGSLAITNALSFPYQPFDLAICFLVFMFFPPSERERFLDRLKENLRPGGAMDVFAKTRRPTSNWNRALASPLDTATSPNTAKSFLSSSQPSVW